MNEIFFTEGNEENEERNATLCFLCLLLFIALLSFIGCSSRRLDLKLPTLSIQETTNNLPPVWPSEVK